MDSEVEKVPKEDFELSSDDELDLGIYLLIKVAGRTHTQKEKKTDSDHQTVSPSASQRLCAVAEVSSPALTSAGPFL